MQRDADRPVIEHGRPEARTPTLHHGAVLGRIGLFIGCVLLSVESGPTIGLLGTAGASSPLKPSAVGPVTSIALSQPATGIVVDAGELLLQHGCTGTLVRPADLRVLGQTGSCSSGNVPDVSKINGAPRLRLRVSFQARGDTIQVEHLDVANRFVVGPVLMTLQNWSWNHSAGPVAGGGSVWIYGLGSRSPGQLVEVSATTGALVHRFRVTLGEDPLLAADATGVWMTEGVWGGPQCSSTCVLDHIAPDSSKLVVVRRAPGEGDEWLMLSGGRVYLDIVRRVRAGDEQSVIGLDEDTGGVFFDTPARFLPGPTFAGAGYSVIGSAATGFFTLAELRPGASTPSTVGCVNGAPVELVRIDPDTGVQSEVFTFPASLVQRDCSNVPLTPWQALSYGHALYLLVNSTSFGAGPYSQLIRVPISTAS